MKKGILASLRTYLKKNPHAWWALYLPFYLTLFFIVEHIVDGSSAYWVSWTPLDDRIPFVEYFVVPYYLWFPLLVGTGLYLMLQDAPAFRRYIWFLGIGLTSIMIFCLLFPNGQDMRPTEFPRDNLFTRLVQMIYLADTNTNVFPSGHVVGAVAAVFAFFDCKKLKKLRIPVIALAVLISISTVFIKQHSVLDIYGGLALSLPIFIALWIVRRKEMRHEKEIACKENSPD